MLTVIFPKDEDNVVRLTWENLHRELNSLVGSELIVGNWMDGLGKTKTDYVCFVESDCIVSGGYFSSNLNLFIKNSHYRKLAMISSCLGVKNFANRIYNYELTQKWEQQGKAKVGAYEIGLSREKKSSQLYPVQIGLFPGAIIRTNSLKKAISDGVKISSNMVKTSTDLSFYFWSTGRRISVNPNTTYVTTETYYEEPQKFKFDSSKAGMVFDKENI